MKILIRDVNNEIVFENFDSNCFKCESSCVSDGNICQCDLNPNEEIRKGKKLHVHSGSFFLCCNKSVAKTTKLFKEKLNMLIYTVPTLKKIKEEVHSQTKQIEQDKYQKIVHNLKTINAQSIQEQFSLIPQDLLAENYGNQIEYITNEIQKNPEKAAIVFLRLAKNNASVKTEFVTHEKLSIENPILSMNNHEIKKVILNVYHAFALELKNKNIALDIFQTKNHLLFDYDTIRVAFYHLFHNATKYIMPSSRLKIDCHEDEYMLIVVVSMFSFPILENEIEKIFEDNYSGVFAQEKKRQGAGLGMGLIKKAIALNGGSIEVIAGEISDKKKKIEYAKNEFILSFNKNQETKLFNMSNRK